MSRRATPAKFSLSRRTAKGQDFYSSDETHIRSLALDASGNLLAGTEPSGRVLRIPKAAANRRAFVLYETSKKEITVAAAGRERRSVCRRRGRENSTRSQGNLAPFRRTIPRHQFVISIGPAGNEPGAPQAQPIPFTPLATVNSSSVYRIAPDGSPEELWSARDDVVYSMGLLPGGKLLLGTGNDGAVLELEGNHVFSKLVKAASRQVTSIAAGPGGKLFLAAANPGKIFTLGPENETEGTYESQPFDAHIFSRWGRTEWWGENIGVRERRRRSRESQSMPARATPPIPKTIGAIGPARTQILPVTSSIVPPRGLCNGRPSCAARPAARPLRSIGSASPTCPKILLRK